MAVTSNFPSCWCGNSDLITFSPGYLRCTACETLVAKLPLPQPARKVVDDQRDFYGREYWFTHQERDLGLSNVVARARADLPERCLHWIRTILRYKLPSAHLLELGSAHGGFVALLRWAGYDAMGLEMSPWIVDFARRTFDVPMSLGPVEDQPIEPGTLDMIVLMDVLEHLPDPGKTMRHCLRLLKPNGIFVIQTPCLPEGKTYEDLKSQEDPFLEMLIEREHLYLFSRSSIQHFFHRLQIDHLKFEPAIFSRYDMFLVASRQPLRPHSSEETEEALLSSSSGRMVQALSDLYLQKEQLLEKYGQSETDRAARLNQIQELTLDVNRLEAERAARLTEVNQLIQKLQESEADRAAQREVIHRLQRVQKLVRTFYGSRTKQILRRIGLLGWLEKRLFGTRHTPIVPEKKGRTQRKEPCSRQGEENKISRMAVDLTPLLPGVENGGAKLLALELVRYLSKLLPDCKFVLLTSERSHEELACLDAPNVQRLCVKHQKNLPVPSTPSRKARMRIRLHEWLTNYLPSPLLAKVKTAYRSLRALRSGTPGILQELDADLLFCPFTMPFYHNPAIPTVSIVYDLQYHYYPQFFSDEDRLGREYHFKETCRLADRLICISEYVRGIVLENSNLSPKHVVSIPIRLLGRLKQPNRDAISTALRKHGLEKEEFLLYPANFWPHKNHDMLFTAMGMFRSRHPESRLRLVCTGFPNERMDALREAIGRMGLEFWVFFPGFLSEEEFAALLASCRALIFPSLYEGFGMPVLEAMVFGKPVLCSNLTSLPEVAGEAALFFDPKKPHEILAAIKRILQEPGLRDHLVTRGYERAAAWGDAEQMVREYVNVFLDAMRGDRRISLGLHGLYSDGWTQEKLVVAYDACPDPRFLEMVAELPPVQPYKRLSIRVSDEATRPRTYFVTQKNPISLRHPLSKKGGFVEFFIKPTFQPKKCGINDDRRWLGCMLRECAILSGTKRESLLEKS